MTGLCRGERGVVPAGIGSGRDNLSKESFRDNRQSSLSGVLESRSHATDSNRSYMLEQKQPRRREDTLYPLK